MGPTLHVVSPFSTRQERDEVDAAVREVNRLLGETPKEERGEGEGTGGEAAFTHHSLLKVDRRYGGQVDIGCEEKSRHSLYMYMYVCMFQVFEC